ncbi:methylornithine synthase PylB [Sporomusa acidovorans]|uniref:[FeFe] hydrogenase maturase subunit HydE n=1 Tax=Sporomusa acidovorans (strain ATCC 49682 / DSM 3132 / Mol) TaxID=1123286 RepID=A0ABZ3IVZ2_SPOA4|nr:methylornithine synthase PylB [Sporomusa acidovorans]OZC24035.1 3-methylornithine synthase [Sporomusa acidovorans DSM 3132]SDF58418.1 pyrrolysine biosynthesis protein PylB [Sporomusa acidovorans]
MMKQLEQILDKAIQRRTLTSQDLIFLLQLTRPAEREQLFKTARMMRRKYFDNKVFLYGFVYFSTYCRNDCTFCFYRKSNSQCRRYRKSSGEIAGIAGALAQSGVHLIDLTMGEDPRYLSDNCTGYQQLIEVVRNVKQQTGLPLMISPGVVPKEVLRQLQQAGADWYACYQETHNRELYGRLRLNQAYDERWSVKVFAKTIGMLVEEGLLVGVGDGVLDAVHSLQEMSRLGADQVRTMTFVPQPGTPLYAAAAVDTQYELNVIAVLRLLFPDRLIPASLDVEGIHGLKGRLNAGANVVTSIIPPDAGLAGVSQSTLDISEGYRTVRGVTPILRECGLKPATRQEYGVWLKRRQGYGLKEGAVCE